MAFEIGETLAVLNFEEGTRLAGARVTVSMDMPVSEYLSIQRAQAALMKAPEDENVATFSESILRKFGDEVLREWDLVKGGQPIPATAEGVMSLPAAHARALIDAWVAAIGTVQGNSRAASVIGA